MPSFSDSIVLFVLALLLFGPKKLPVLARELGKWIGEFRRASNEFKMQMEEELRLSEASEREQKIAAIEAAAPVAPILSPAEEIPEPEHPHIAPYLDPEPVTPAAETPAPLPIASSGELNMMPPATGLPVSRSASRPATSSDPLGGLLSNIPSVPDAADARPENAKDNATNA
jgi:sec-independent protein translocase protein TatB